MVRISEREFAIEIRQFSASLQEMCSRFGSAVPAGSASGLAVQVAPPSVEASSVFLSPTANAVVGLTNVSALRPCAEEPTSVHELAASVVRWIVPPASPPVTEKPVVGETNCRPEASAASPGGERDRRSSPGPSLAAVVGEQDLAAGLLHEAGAWAR